MMFSLMVGAGETYLPAFAVEAGMGETMVGFFTIVPMVVGALVQLLTPYLAAKVGSVKRWVVGATAVQALAFLPLLYFSFSPTENFLILFLIAGLYWGAGFAAGPTWNFWMGQLVPSHLSETYFSLRLRISQFGILIGLIGGGLALHHQVHVGVFTSVFSIIFLLAFLFRASSSLILSVKAYSPNWHYTGQGPRLRETLHAFVGHHEYRSFFGFLFVFLMVIFISGPFVTPYFLKKLQLNYSDYMWILAALFVAKILALPIAEKLMARYGVKFVFFLGAIGLSPLPALWSLSDNFWFMVALQASSGAFWALFEVALSVVFFNQLKSHDKIPVLTLYNFFNSSAMVLGTLIGGKILHGMGESLQAYYWIFIIGSGLRVIVSAVYLIKMKNRSVFLSENLREALGGIKPGALQISRLIKGH